MPPGFTSNTVNLDSRVGLAQYTFLLLYWGGVGSVLQEETMAVHHMEMDGKGFKAICRLFKLFFLVIGLLSFILKE